MKLQNLDTERERDDMRFSRRSVYLVTECISACIFSYLRSVLQRIGRTVSTSVYKAYINITCSTVVLQCYRRQAIPMEQAKIRPSVTL